MAAGFTLTGAINLQVANVQQLKSQIKRQFAGTNIQVTVTHDGIVKSKDELKRLKAEAKATERALKGAQDRMASFGQQTGLAVKRFAAFVTGTVVLRNFATAFSNAFSDAIDFEKELVKISQTTGTTTKSLSNMVREVNKLATGFGISSKELLESSRILVQAGLSAKDTTILLKVLAKTDLSPSFDNMVDSGEGMIAMMSQFGTKAEDMEKKFSAINSVSKAFAVESEDIITAIRRTGGAFQAAGGSVEELIALFTSVRATTRESAESIATGFRTIFARIQRIRTVGFLENLGIQLRDAEGQFVGPLKAIERLSAALNSLPSTDPRFAQIIEELGGFRQVSKVIPLIKQFGVTQQALNVAQRGQNSLTEDAAKSQEALGRSFIKTKEEFQQMVRAFAADDNIRKMLKFMFDAAQAAIKLADSLRPLIPLITLIGGAKLFGLGGAFLKGNLSSGKASGLKTGLGFASGGRVPGSGNGDTVPAMLTPGEFVLNKKTVKKIGLANLENIQKFARGGVVQDPRGNTRFGLLAGEESSKNIVGNDSTVHFKKGQTPNAKIGKNAVKYLKNNIFASTEKGGLGLDSLSVNVDVGHVSANKSTKQKETFEQPITEAIGKIAAHFSSSISKDGTLKTAKIPDVSKGVYEKAFTQQGKGRVFEAAVHTALGTKISNIGRTFDLAPSSKNLDKFTEGGKFAGIYSDLKLSNNKDSVFSVAGKAIRSIIEDDFRVNRDGSSDSSNRDNFVGSSQPRRKKQSPIGRNAGGHVPGAGNTDTVPAMLTPGEFVINKRAAKKIGFDKLSQLNRLNRGGLVRRFALGADKATGSPVATPLILGSLIQFGAEVSNASEETRKWTDLLSTAAVQMGIFTAFLKSSGNIAKAGGNVERLEGTKESLRAEFANLVGDRGRKLIDASLNEETNRTPEIQKERQKLLKRRNAAKTTVSASPLDPLALQKLERAQAKVDANTEAFKKNREQINLLNKAQIENISKVVENEKAYAENAEALKKANTALNRMVLTAFAFAGAVAVFSAIGASLEGQARKKIDSGSGTKADAEDLALGESFQTGATTAGIIGAFATQLPPKAAIAVGIIGTIIGIIQGLFKYESALKEAESKIRQLDFEKTSGNLGKILQRVNSGEVSALSQTSQIQSITRRAEESLSKSVSDEELSNLTANIETQLPAIQGFLNKIAEGSKSLEEFNRAAGKTTVDLFTGFSNVDPKEFQKQIAEQIKAQNDSIVQSEKFAKSLSAFNRNTTFLLDLAAALSVVTTRVQDLDGTIATITGAGNRGFRDNSSVLSNLGKFGDSKLFDEALTTASGIAGPRAAGAIEQARLFNEFGKFLPGIITDVASRAPLEGEGLFSEMLDKQLQAVFGTGGNKDIVRNTILSALDQDIIGNEGDDTKAIEKARKELPNMVETLLAAGKPIGDAIGNSLKALNQIEGSFAQGLAKIGELHNKIVEGQLSIVEQQQRAFDITQGFSGNKSFSTAFEDRRRAIVEGTTGTLDPQALLRTVLSSRQNEEAINQQLNSGVGDRKALIQAREEEIRAAERASKALEFLADDASRTKDSLAKLSDLNDAQGRKVDLVESFVFGNTQERNNIGDQISNLAKVLVAGDDINAIPGDARAGVLNILRSFGTDKLDFFRKNGQARSGQETAEAITLNQLKRDLPGVDPKFLEKFAKRLSTDEQLQLQQEISKTLISSLEASNALKTINERIATALELKIPQKFVELKQAVEKTLNDTANNRDKQDLSQKTGERDRLVLIEQRLGKLAELGFITNGNKNLSGDVNNTIAAVEQADEAQKAINKFYDAISDTAINEPFAKSKDGNFDFKLKDRVSAELQDRGVGLGRGEIAKKIDVSAKGISSFLETVEGKEFLKNNEFLKEQGVDPNNLTNIYRRGRFDAFKTEHGFDELRLRNPRGGKELKASESFKVELFKSLIEYQLKERLNTLKDNRSNAEARLPEDIKNNLAAVRKNFDFLKETAKLLEGQDTTTIRDNIKVLNEYIETLNKRITAPAAVVVPAIGKNRGGPIPGSGNTDTVPAMLTPGEFVLRKDAVKSIGLKNLFAMNAQRFADGGLVAASDRDSDRYKKLFERDALSFTPGTRLSPSTVDYISKELNLPKDKLSALSFQETLEDFESSGPSFKKKLGNIIGGGYKGPTWAIKKDRTGAFSFETPYGKKHKLSDKQFKDVFGLVMAWKMASIGVPKQKEPKRSENSEFLANRMKRLDEEIKAVTSLPRFQEMLRQQNIDKINQQLENTRASAMQNISKTETVKPNNNASKFLPTVPLLNNIIKENGVAAMPAPIEPYKFQESAAPKVNGVTPQAKPGHRIITLQNGAQLEVPNAPLDLKANQELFDKRVAEENARNLEAKKIREAKNKKTEQIAAGLRGSQNSLRQSSFASKFQKELGFAAFAPTFLATRTSEALGLDLYAKAFAENNDYIASEWFGKELKRRNSGGPIPGVGNMDTVPAMLTPGEFVINKNAAKAIGSDKLFALNAKRFNDGGPVKGTMTQKEYTDYVSRVRSGQQQAASPSFAMPGLKEFSASVSKLTTALSAFPHEVSHKITGNLEVVLNGVQVVAEIMPGLKEYINKEIVRSVNKVVKDKFPDIS